MNSRQYDNVPPLANTVTISTSAPPQVRLASGAQMRPIAVPMRPQPVPIRKVVHDGGGLSGASTSNNQQFTSIHHTIKDEQDVIDYQTASTSSSGPLIASSSSMSNSFQQYQRGSSSSGGGLTSSGALIGPTSSTTSSGPLNGGLGGGGLAMDQPAPVNLASKVAEVFLTAGHAFQKLGDLTLQLHTTTDADESKWSEKEVDTLKNALTRFAHELDQISTCVANRTTKHIKNDIKRRHLMATDEMTSVPQIKRMNVVGGGQSSSSIGNTYINSQGAIIGSSSTSSTSHPVPLQQKRIGMQPIGKMMTTRTLIPTRYTVAPGSSTLIPNSTVVVSTSGQQSSSSSSTGMPQLQSQSGTTSGQRQMTSTSSGALPQQTQTRVMTTPMVSKLSGNTVGGGGQSSTQSSQSSSGTKRVMTPTSGAFVLE